MIRVKIELVSAVDGRTETLGVMEICNEGTGTAKRGNYSGVVYRKGTMKGLRNGKVKNYPRQSYNVWRLILKMLKECFPEEQKG